MTRRLTREELGALRREIASQDGQDGWGVTLVSIDGEPADSYTPAEDETP